LRLVLLVLLLLGRRLLVVGRNLLLVGVERRLPHGLLPHSGGGLLLVLVLHRGLLVQGLLVHGWLVVPGISAWRKLPHPLAVSGAYSSRLSAVPQRPVIEAVPDVLLYGLPPPLATGGAIGDRLDDELLLVVAEPDAVSYAQPLGSVPDQVVAYKAAVERRVPEDSDGR
jgi:hypothetical protein